MLNSKRWESTITFVCCFLLVTGMFAGPVWAASSNPCSGEVVIELIVDQSVTGTVAGIQTNWYQLPVSTGSTFIIDLATEHDVAGYIYDTNCAILGQSGRSHAFRISGSSQPMFVAVTQNGPEHGDYRLTIHTNDIPFYKQEVYSHWPSSLQSASNYFPNTDFGYVFLNENHTNQTDSILKIAVAKMCSTNPLAQPIVFCNGGPGASSIMTLYQYALKAFTDDYDLYLVDQRGINFSQPCVFSRVNESIPETQHRLEVLEEVDLDTINTLQSALDLDTFAQVLGLTNVSIWGASYGTLLVQQVMRMEPAWLVTAILDGAAAPSQSFMGQVNLSYGIALDALTHDIDTSVGAIYPEYAKQFLDVAWLVTSNPITLLFDEGPFEIGRDAFFYSIRKQIQLSDLSGREYIPSIIWRASQGNTSALTELFTRGNTNIFYPPGVDSLNMKGIVLKHDFMPYESLANATNYNAELPSPMREYANFYSTGIFTYGEAWSVGTADADITNLVTTTLPTLLLAGTYDPQTSTNWAAIVAAGLSNSWVIALPGAGHGALLAGSCPEAIVRNFLAAPLQDPTDYCLGSMPLTFPPPWPSNAAVLVEGLSVTGEFAQAGQGTWFALHAQTGTYYSLYVGSADSRQILRIVDTNAVITAGATNSVLRWYCDRSDTYYVWLIAQTDATYAIRYRSATHPIGDVIDDFDGDGRTDVAVYWPEAGNWYLDYSGGGIATLNWGWNATIPSPADYDGDGITDLAVYWPETGTWYLHYSSGGTHSLTWGWSATIPVPGDYDGDGRADMAVYYADLGTWYILESGTGSMRTENWGWAEAIPVPGDYDGDTITDIAVYSTTHGTWYLKLSSSGSLDQRDWGWPGVVPVPADYDGDRLTDLAVYFPQTGTWFILNSSGGGSTIQWGWTDSIPLPGDYDGDGLADVTIYDQNSGTWYIRRSSNQQLDQRNWGWSATYGVWPQMWINVKFTGVPQDAKAISLLRLLGKTGIPQL